MARCPDCSKFVGYDTDTEPEIEDIEVAQDDLYITGQVRVVLACSECGTELKESYQDFEEYFDHECEPENEAKVDDYQPEVDERFEVEDSSAMFHDRMQTHTPTGKPIKNPRYAKRYYGAEVHATIKCNQCGESFDVSATTEEQASHFDEV